MGENLLGEITTATGLPADLIGEELNQLIQKAGLERDTVTLEDLRQVLAEYVQDILLALKDENLANSSNEG